MSRKKAKDQAQMFTQAIRTRVTETVFKRLNAFVGNGDCHSIGEVARRILSKEKILCLYRDNSMDLVMEQLTSIRKELNAIGVNINQVTHHFHTAESGEQRMFHTLKVAEQYKKVGDRVEELLVLVSEMAKKWLQK